MVSNEMMPYVNMLGASMLDGVVGDLHCSSIVTSKRHLVIGNSMVLQGLPHP